MTSPGPLLAIRADASHRTGTGHVMRTLSIAQEWISRGGRVLFLCAEIPQALERHLLAADACLTRIDAPDDATATATAATTHKAVILLVDHYDLTEAWWHALPAGRHWKTAALNDFTDPIHPLAEIRISPRATALPGEPHSGPDFLLIRNEIRRISPPAPPAPRAAKMLLVLGGADPKNAGPTTAAFILSNAPDTDLRVIVGPAAANLEEFNELASGRSRLDVVHCPESMLPHYEWADTVVVSPSTTAFEALHHGLVTGLILTTGNQEEAAADLVRRHSAVLLADSRQPGWQFDTAVFRQLIGNENSRRELVHNGVAMVDGCGAARACDVLGLPEIFFRPAAANDAHLTWRWANDPQTRAASFSSNPIPWETHAAWLAKRLTLPHPIWLAHDTAGQPLALIRFDAAGQEGVHTISINLAPPARGRDLSALIVVRAVTAFRMNHPHAVLHAWIKDSNPASRRCFTRAGFHKVDGAGFEDRLLYLQFP
jgi:UDP-2,4-diacetamido-2,4,6-trideoxy-beta-L-altropyranose hydrolase